jgi:hypothetical protein
MQRLEGSLLALWQGLDTSGYPLQHVSKTRVKRSVNVVERTTSEACASWSFYGRKGIAKVSMFGARQSTRLGSPFLESAVNYCQSYPCQLPVALPGAYRRCASDTACPSADHGLGPFGVERPNQVREGRTVPGPMTANRPSWPPQRRWKPHRVAQIGASAVGTLNRDMDVSLHRRPGASAHHATGKITQHGIDCIPGVHSASEELSTLSLEDFRNISSQCMLSRVQ